MKMNLPNKLTMLRVIMIPFFVAVMVYSGPQSRLYAEALSTGVMGTYINMRIIACVIFCAASFTDFLDGYIARKNNLVTNFGKFMDPLADKLLVTSALILLCGEGLLPSWIVIIIVGREFIISGFRLVASDNGVVIAASWWGKWKTVSQMVMCILLILPNTVSWLGVWPIRIIIALSVVLTVVSLVDYIVKNIKVITDGGM